MRAILGTVLVTLALVAGVALWLTQPTKAVQGFCLTRVGTTVVETDLEQSQWATHMAAIASKRQLPPRATTIAIATAYQESKIRNIDYGDRDSLGLFQQRPSQGWGSAEQIMDPTYAINAFYDALIDVDDYWTMDITKAAQQVQRSAFPDAYAQHEAKARALASALRGHSPAAFGCVVAEKPGSIATVSDQMNTFWPSVEVKSVGDEHRIDVSDAREGAGIHGWAIAHFLVANAAELGIASVSFDDMRWEAKSQSPDWVPTEGVGTTHVTFTLN